MINTFIFDIGNVLLDFDYMKQFRRLFDEETAQTIADISVRRYEVWIELDRGVLTYEQVVDGIVRAAPHLEAEIRLAVKELYERVEAYTYAEEFLRRVKEKGYRIYILSNYGEQPFAASKSRMPFLKYADGQLISYEIKETKPNPVIYQALFDRYSILPEEAVFLDDSAKNIAGAKAVGLHTIHFKGYEAAVEELKTLPLAYGI